MSLHNSNNDDLMEELLEQIRLLPENNNNNNNNNSFDHQCGDEASTSSSLLLFEQPVMTLEQRVLSLVNSLHPHEEDIRTIQNADPAELDAILTKEMNRLSMAEQDTAALEVHGFVANDSNDDHDGATTTTHGVVQVVDNDAMFVQEQLQQMDECLTRIIRRNDATTTTTTIGIIKTEAYERALYQSPDYVQNDKFRLLFLRGERFDPVLAATRLIRHFHEKQLLFTTPDLLARDVQWNDLEESDKEAVQSGFVQILPCRDCANRAVVCLIPSLFPRAALPRVRM
jgi:hypothetical protein